MGVSAAVGRQGRGFGRSDTVHTPTVVDVFPRYLDSAAASSGRLAPDGASGSIDRPFRRTGGTAGHAAFRSDGRPGGPREHRSEFSVSF